MIYFLISPLLLQLRAENLHISIFTQNFDIKQHSVSFALLNLWYDDKLVETGLVMFNNMENERILMSPVILLFCININCCSLRKRCGIMVFYPLVKNISLYQGNQFWDDRENSAREKVEFKTLW